MNLIAPEKPMIQAIQAFLLDHAEEVKNDGEVVGYTLNLSMDEMDQLLTILERQPIMQ